MYWSEVFSHSKVAPFDLSKGSPSGESENYGKPATGKALHLQVVLFYGGSNGAVMSTIRCTRSPKRKRGKKKKKARQAELQKPPSHCAASAAPEHCCGEARPWQLCHRASCCVHVSWNVSLTALAVCSDALLQCSHYNGLKTRAQFAASDFNILQ